MVSRARRIASVRRDAYDGGSTLGAAKAPKKEAYTAMSDGDDGYWDERTRDQSVRAGSAYMRVCWSKWAYQHAFGPNSTRDRVGPWEGSFCFSSWEAGHPRSKRLWGVLKALEHVGWV